MTNKSFNKVSSLILVMSLLYIPAKGCNAYGCEFLSWMPLFNAYPLIDLTRLIIQELIIGLLIFFIYQFVDNSND